MFYNAALFAWREFRTSRVPSVAPITHLLGLRSVFEGNVFRQHSLGGGGPFLL